MRPSKKSRKIEGKEQSRTVKHLDSDSEDDFELDVNGVKQPEHHEYEDPYYDEEDESEEIIEEVSEGEDDEDDDDVTFASEDLSKLSIQHGSIEKAIEALGGKLKPAGDKPSKKDEKMNDENDGEENDDDDEFIDEDEEGDEEEESEINANIKIWRPDMAIKPSEKLQFSNSAYTMFYTVNVDWPALSFDILRDDLGYQRTMFPHTVYAAFGTQAAKDGQNKLQLLKMSDMYKTQYDSDESDVEDDENDEALDDDPVLESNHQNLPSEVNRMRIMPQSKIAALWMEDGKVLLYDLAPQYRTLNIGLEQNTNKGVIHQISSHKAEGFAMAWSNVKQGRLATGDCSGKIYLHEMSRNGDDYSWSTGEEYSSHKQSVEDLQFSPVEANVFASCSCDRTIRIWDQRSKKSALSITASDDHDVNVISWNPNYTYLLASGDDAGVLRIWDMRNRAEPVGQFTYHKKSITSVEWHPSDPSMLVVSSDDQTTIWDLSVERDEEQEQLERGHALPPQLMFVHLGQQQVKEAHWHPQINNVVMTTALDGFNIFKPSNLD
ncbi:ribosome assembly protein rrb1 [Acrasis kona]|uniref:Ribosome assembly protein rrb1 n=1 Tax=Acrasis kona TaxID=1008807 RepID=A0AAW2Z6P8_9EUKA